MTPRERQEAWETSALAPWAARAAESRGRERPEPQDPVRTVYQRDRDRVLHSKAFRRLKHKTQVFIDPEEDHYRTRLTHTLEVSQIARTVSRALRLNEDLTEAIALAHDLGHSPFGHAGEEALDAVLREFVPEARFRHDVQSLRMVEVLESHGGEPGLNLTWEVREGIAHHSKGMRSLTDAGARLSETLEGQVVRVADRVAYVNHDVDDAVRARFLSPEDIPSDLRDTLGSTPSQRIGTMVIDIIACSEERPIIAMSPEMAGAVDRLKGLLFERVYGPLRTENADLAKAQRVVQDLFRLYMEHPDRMPDGRGAAGLPIEERAQKVCDYMAGMTDRYAVARFVRHFLPHGLSALTQP
jgi:dGTPase